MIDKDILDKIKAGAKVRVTERVILDLSLQRKGAKIAVKSSKQEKKDIKERVSTFEGLVIARKHGSEAGATFTVRSTVAGVGMEKVYPIHSPTIKKVEILTSPNKPKRSKIYFIRDLSAKGIRKKLKTTN